MDKISKALTALAVLMLFLAATPVTSAYKGYQLSRGPVADFTLTNQTGDEVQLSDFRGDVVVVAFIFTTCPDVCPIITQLLRSVDEGLTQEYSEHISIISITVDPERDTPEVLQDFTELHGADWPHLTGDVADLDAVYASFGIVVEKTIIDIHVEEATGHQSADPTFTIVNKSGVSQELMVMFDGWIATKLIQDQYDLEFNFTISQDGVPSVTQIGNLQADNNSSLVASYYDAEQQSWSEPIDDLKKISREKAGHIAWVKSSSQIDNLSTPSNEVSSMVILNENNTEDVYASGNYSGWHHTVGALETAEIPYQSSKSPPPLGHFMTSIGGEDPSADNWTWWWELHEWNTTSNAWQASEVGLDSITNPQHLAFAPNTTNDSEIPVPGAYAPPAEVVCNGHGWEMGSGASKHCMCDSGYEWPEETMLSCVAVESTEEYTVGHSTTTFILDTKYKPVVAWTGDSWNAEEFISDLESVVESEGLVESDENNTPGFAIISAIVGISLATVFINARRQDEFEE